MPHKDPIAKKEYFKKYREKNKIKIREKHRKWSKENKDKVIEYREKRREKAIEYFRRFNKTEKRKEYMRKYSLNYYHQNKKDPNFKIKFNLRHRVYMALIRKTKSKRTMDLLGCTVEKLWDHLESLFKPGMTRDNYGSWHVDHIIPCSKFDLTKEENQKMCFHYSNLQPLWAEENISKSDKII